MTTPEGARAEALEKFWARLIEHFGHDSYNELDTDQFTEFAESCGLIRWEAYDEKVHGEMDVDPGDKIWLPNVAPALARAAQGAPPEGALREALVFLHNATLAKKTDSAWWLEVGEPMIRAALATPEPQARQPEGKP